MARPTARGTETESRPARFMRSALEILGETGRTDGLNGSLSGLSGAPAVDDMGRVVGVTIAESPRRGRIYTTAPETGRGLLTSTRHQPAGAAPGEPVTTDNYGRVGDNLRRDLRVAQVVCLMA